MAITSCENISMPLGVQKDIARKFDRTIGKPVFTTKKG